MKYLLLVLSMTQLVSCYSVKKGEIMPNKEIEEKQMQKVIDSLENQQTKLPHQLLNHIL